MICILGSEGSQGRRYQAILGYMRRPFYCFDPKTSKDVRTAAEILAPASHIIIATPTSTHRAWIESALKTQVPILCEKPVTTNIQEMHEIAGWVERANVSFSMVYQYRHLVDGKGYPAGHTKYDYFRHGNDGLVWDCLQIIGLARGEIRLAESSPIWDCRINGQKLSLAHMDKAYLTEVVDWLNGIQKLPLDQIVAIHEKVHSFVKNQSQ